MISQHLLADRAKVAGLVITDDEIAQYIGNEQAFQDNGKFDNKRYAAVLANNNLSPLMYEARVRDELAKQQLNDTYVQNGYVSKVSAEKIMRLYEQQRVVSVATIPLQSLMAQVKVDQAAIKKYYDDHQKDFSVPEQARVEYVKFSADGLMAKTIVSAEEARKFYDEHQADYSQAEQRQASHILIAAATKAPQAEQDAAKVKAENILAQLKQNPGKFAELAKEFSQDPGSAAKGGDLGLFGRGLMVKPFEDAAFSLKQGETSGLVKSDFGYHIIKVTAIKAARVLPFDEAREGVMIKLRLQKANEKFAELAEKFSNTVYEQSDTLKPAAELADAKIEQSGWLSKGVSSSELWNAKTLQAVFSDDVLKNKRNTTAMEIAPSTLLAARVLEYKPSSVRALSDVQATIQERLTREQAMTLAAQQGKSALDELQKSGKSSLVWGAAQTVSREKHGNLDAETVRQIFQANAAKLPQYVGIEAAQSGYSIVRIEAVKEGEQMDEAKLNRYTQQLRQLSGDGIF
ncbi:MAG: peptidylprolyl isomerase, partial [Gallionella sp.]